MKNNDDIEDWLTKSIFISFSYSIVTCIAVIVALVLFSSCRTIRQEKVITLHDTTTVYKVQRDSIHIVDSVSFETTAKGDTVYLIKEKWRTVYVDRLHHDSIYISKTDTVYREKEIEKQQTIVQRVRSWAGGFFIFAAILIGGYIGIRWFLAKWLER